MPDWFVSWSKGDKCGVEPCGSEQAANRLAASYRSAGCEAIAFSERSSADYAVQPRSEPLPAIRTVESLGEEERPRFALVDEHGNNKCTNENGLLMLVCFKTRDDAKLFASKLPKRYRVREIPPEQWEAEMQEVASKGCEWICVLDEIGEDECFKEVFNISYT